MDTPDKRASAIGLCLPFRVLPVPDGAALSVGDRKQVTYSYPGTLTAAGLTQGPDWLEKLNGSSNRLSALAG